MPFAGIICRLTPMLMIDWKPNTTYQPRHRVAGEVVMLLQRACQSAQHDEGEQLHDQADTGDGRIPRRPPRKTKSAWLSGMSASMIDPHPVRHPSHLPLIKASRPMLDLERIALAGEEAVDAAGEMREDRVGAERLAATQTAEAMRSRTTTCRP